MLAKVKLLNVALRVVMELGLVVTLGYWGAQTSVWLMIAAPVLAFGFWGLVDFRQAGAGAEALRLIQELLLTGLAAGAAYTAGAQTLGWALGAISIAHHVLVYLLGDKLLRPKPATPAHPAE